MNIIGYRDCNDIDVQFEDGVIVASNRCKKGEIRNPSFSSHLKVGETNTANNGQKMTIISYRGNRDIDIQFDDGTIVVNKTYGCFKRGEIKNPNLNPYKSRLGETNTAINGQKMTIIAYRRYGDIDVQFEDGTMVDNKSYTSFKKGEIKNPSYNPYRSRLGETNTAINDQKMTIIAYRDSQDIDIQFEDGTILTNKTYSNFKSGRIKNPNYYTNKYLGETNLATNKQKMIIISYRSSTDIDIQFEDGTIVTNKLYSNFKSGRVKNPNYISKLGETNIANNGQKMTIVSYRSYKDIDVQFEDGTIVTSILYPVFKGGRVKNPNYNPYESRLGEVGINNDGQKMTIIAYRGYGDIDIQFEDGTIVASKDYGKFKRGMIRNTNFNPYKSRLGEVGINNNGQKMTIIAYRSYTDIDIQFEDGTIVYNERYDRFKMGGVKNSNFISPTRLGETTTANNGLKMIIVAYRHSANVDIQFEDGTVVTNKNYTGFKNGKVAHPAINTKYWGILKDHKLLGLAYKLSDKSVYYYCECTKCGEKDILSPQQILSHKCEG